MHSPLLVRAAALLHLSPDVAGRLLARVEAVLRTADGGGDGVHRDVSRVIAALGPELAAAATAAGMTVESMAAGLVSVSIALNRLVADFPASAKDESHLASRYAGRAVLELLQNTHDSVGMVLRLALIGKFGIGVKSLSGVADAILLRSGAFHLRFDPDAVRQLRPDLPAGLDIPLFEFPLPVLEAEDAPPVPEVRCGIGLIDHGGRTWLWVRHAGKPFSATDVDAFRRRGFSGKDGQGAHAPEGGTTELMFRLREDAAAIEAIRRELASLDASALLFLPALSSLRIDAVGPIDLAVSVTEQRPDGFEVVQLSPGGASWARLIDGERAIAIPLDARARERCRTGSLACWFPLRDIRPGFPFLVHDSALALRDDRNALLPGKATGARLRTLGEWAAGALANLAGALPAAPAGDLGGDLPRGMLPSGGGQADPVLEAPADTPQAVATLRAAYVRTMAAGDAPIISLVRGGPAPAHACVVAWGDAAAGAVHAAEAIEAAVGRRLADPAATQWIESHGARDLFPGLVALDGGGVAKAIAALGASGAGTRLDRLRPVGPHDSDRPVLDALIALVERVPEPAAFPTHHVLAVPVRALGEGTPRGVLLPGELLGEQAAVHLERAGYLVASGVGSKGAKLLGGSGAVEARWEELLDSLHIQAEARGSADDSGAMAASAEALRLAARAVADLDLSDRVRGQHPLVDLVSHYAALDIEHWHTKGASLWGAHPDRRARLSLSRLRSPTRAGSWRAVGELCLGDDARVPASLRADVEGVAASLGCDEAAARSFLAAAGAWPHFPLVVRCRRLDEDALADAVFDAWFGGWSPPPGWLRTIPSLAGRRGHRARLPRDRARLPLDAASCLPALPGGRGKTNRLGGEWCWAAGHRTDDRLAVVVDAPPECVARDGALDPAVAPLLLDALAAAGAPLASTWLVDAPAWSEGGRAWAYRCSAPGDLASPLLHRLRRTRFLPVHPQADCGWLGMGDRLAPLESTYWPRPQLDRAPSRALPVAEVTPELAELLVLGAPPSDPAEGAEIIDPRWVIATLVRMAARSPGGGAGEPPVDKLGAVVARLYSHLGHALGLEARGGRPERPAPGETWAKFYAKSPLDAGEDRAATLLAWWTADAVECGFLDDGALPAGWSHPSGANPPDLAANLPLHVAGASGGRWTTVAELRRTGSGVVAVDESAEVRARVARELGLVSFPRNGAELARLLRLPLFAPAGPAEPPPVPTPPGWSPGFERALVRALPWLRGAAAEAAANVDIDALEARTAPGVEWHYATHLAAGAALLGFPGKTWRGASERPDFRCLRPATETRGRITVARIGVDGTLGAELLRARLDALAPALAEAMDLRGPAARVSLENVLHRCSEPSVWEALTTGTPLPAPFRSFLRARGWGADDEDARRLREQLDTLLAELGRPALEPPANVADPGEALRSALSGRGVPAAAWDARLAGCDDRALPFALVAWVAADAKADAEALASALKTCRLRVDSLGDGTPLPAAASGVQARLGPYLEALVGAGLVEPAPPPFDAELYLLPDELALSRAWMAHEVSAVGDGRLADALLAANGADGALDAVLREFGVEPPAVAARRNAAWVELFQAVARTAPGAVALAMLLATPEVSPAQLLADWQAAPRPAAIRLCAGAGPALTRAALASLVGIPDTHAGEGTVDAASVEGTLVGWARARFGDEFDALLRTLRRPLRLLGKSFVSEAAALAALEGRRAELNAAGGTSTEAVLDDPGDAPASGGGGGGGGARFSARASVVGREGERYLRERLLAGALPPGVAGADEVRVFDVSTADRAREACANPLVRDWLGDAQVSDHPGFDLLLAMRHADAWTWEGIEVKSTVDPLDGELCFDFTENELRTARGLQPEGGWPVARYRIACVTRLWSVDATGALLAPQLTWLTDPAALIEQNRVRLDTEERRTVRQRLTARVRTRG